MICNFRTKQTIKAPIPSDSQPITITNSFKSLGPHVSNNLSKARFTGPMLHSHNPKHPVTIIYWYGNTFKRTIKKKDRIIIRTPKIIGCKLPTLDSIYTPSHKQSRSWMTLFNNFPLKEVTGHTRQEENKMTKKNKKTC